MIRAPYTEIFDIFAYLQARTQHLLVVGVLLSQDDWKNTWKSVLNLNRHLFPSYIRCMLQRLQCLSKFAGRLMFSTCFQAIEVTKVLQPLAFSETASSIY